MRAGAVATTHWLYIVDEEPRHVAFGIPPAARICNPVRILAKSSITLAILVNSDNCFVEIFSSLIEARLLYASSASFISFRSKDPRSAVEINDQ